jgi:serine/threonine protein kinase
LNTAAGTRLGRYEIRSKIGEGGIGEVYLAQDTKLDRKVALKILPVDPVDVAVDDDRMRPSVQEARSASGLNHPNIITISASYSCFISNDWPLTQIVRSD